MRTSQQSESLSVIASIPAFRIIDGLSISFVEGDRQGPHSSNGGGVSPNRLVEAGTVCMISKI
jgi:hypothetical protein